jgi:hypothetical protein
MTAAGRHLIRSDSPAGLTPAGWAALWGHGIRTIVDLRNDDERQDPAAPGAAGMAVVHVPLDDLADSAFWRRVWDEGLDGTPLYYRPFLERKPERCAAAVAAVADAGPGGVLVHCTVGRDRAGLVTLLLVLGGAPGRPGPGRLPGPAGHDRPRVHPGHPGGGRRRGRPPRRRAQRSPAARGSPPAAGAFCSRAGGGPSATHSDPAWSTVRAIGSLSSPKKRP